MARLITVALRLLIWLLLSADISLINFLIGLLGRLWKTRAIRAKIHV